MEQYQSLLKNNASLAEIVKFMDGNVSQVSSNNAVMIVDEFEKGKKSFYLSSRKIRGEWGYPKQDGGSILQEFDISKIDSIEDEELQMLLKETKESGYKVETAEGTFFPVINYEVYKNTVIM